METLNRTIMYNGFTYELVKRNRHVGIYAQYCDDEVIAYEVFQIKIQKEQTRKIGDVLVHFPEKERFPNNEAFGYTAFTCRTLEKAEKRMQDLTLNIELRLKGIGLN